jgi:hypothetical protein
MRTLTRHFLRSTLAIVAPVALVGASGLPAVAQVVSTSDLSISIVSAPPRHAKACETFDATYAITNLGPDDATGTYVQINIPDQFEVVDLLGVPASLAVGESATVDVVVKVVAFVPGESRTAWVSARVASDPYPDVSIDPDPSNDSVTSPVKLISKQVVSCP